MAKVTINVDRYKGVYELDAEVPMTGLDWRWIKKISGYLPLTIEAGFEGDDNDLYIALAVIALHRASKIRAAEAMMVAELLLSAPVDGKSIILDFTDEDEEKAALADEEQADLSGEA